MSETQAIEPVNEEVVSDDATLLAEQEAYLNEGEPKAEEEPAPEPEKVESEAKTDEGKAANLQKALAESRFENRQTQRQIKEMREALAALREPAEQRQQEPVIDPDKDPHGAIRYLVAKVNAYEKQQADYERQQAEESQQQQAVTELTNFMGEAEQLARTELPDYDHAMSFQLQSRQSELKALGYPDDQIPDLVKNEYLGLIHQARQNGQNPAYLVYQQAKARGYAGPPPEGAEMAPAPANGAAQQQLEAMRKGQQTPKTTRGGGGSGNSGKITEEMLMNASGTEFDKLWAQFEKQNAS